MVLLDSNLVSELRKVRPGKADPGVAAWAERVDAACLAGFEASGVELLNPWHQVG